MSALELRPYQRDIIDEFDRRIAAGDRRIMLVAPTGSGKTVIAGAIIRQTVQARKFVLVLAHRREIIGQTCEKLRDLAIPCGIIMAGVQERPLENVQVAAIQTLHRRAIGAEVMELPPADLLVIDEAHHCPAKTYQEIIDQYPNVVLLGLTATPCRADGRGLGSVFQVIVQCPQVAELITQGYLVKTRVYAPAEPDLKGVKVQAGDYVESQLADRMDRPKLIGDIVTHWHKYGERRKTVAFAVNVSHSIHLRDEFIKSGVRAEHIDGSTPKPERDATLSRLASGEIELVTNCMVLTEGWDLPEVACAILARPTRKMGLFRQMIGRILRPAPGKSDAIVLDHSGAVFRHGFVEDEVSWTLDPERRAESPAHQKRCETHGSRLLECTQCGAIRVGGEPCPSCGFLPQRPPKPVVFGDGELAEVGRDRSTKPNVYDPATRAQWFAMLTAIKVERNYKANWPAVNYKEKFGVWPPWGTVVQPIPPSARSALLGALASHRICQGQGCMKRKRKPEKTDLFVKVMLDTLDTPAWRAMSHGARSLYVALKRRLRNDLSNNGKIFLSQRQAEAELGSSRRYVGRWFRELEHYGFIVMTKHGNLGIEGKGKAPHWRLTEAGYKDDPPSRDYINWNRARFGVTKKQNPGAQKCTTLGHKSAPLVDHKCAPPCLTTIPNHGPQKRTISRSALHLHRAATGERADGDAVQPPIPSPRKGNRMSTDRQRGTPASALT